MYKDKSRREKFIFFVEIAIVSDHDSDQIDWHHPPGFDTSYELSNAVAGP